MICQPHRRKKLFVVDQRTEDYLEFVHGVEDAETEVIFFTSACEALRTNPDEEPFMWIVNMQLPDMKGTDLQHMLRTRGGTSPVVLVGDEYEVTDEIDARSSGAALYFVKPLHTDMLLATC